MRHQPGVILCNLFLADELNRATSRTQSALLEAMEEGQGHGRRCESQIPEPFCVFATQNRQALPARSCCRIRRWTALRSAFRSAIRHQRDEREILLSRQKGQSSLQVRQVVTREELLTMQQEAANVYVKPELADYIVSLVGKTRNDPLIARGQAPERRCLSARWQRRLPMSREEIMSSPRIFRTVRLDLRAQAASIR